MTRFKTADLCDDHGEGVAVCALTWLRHGPRRGFCGTIVTIRCLEDNGLIKQAVARDGAGQVLVVDGGGSLRCALVGDQVAAQAQANGWAGIIVFGAIRDTAELDAMDIPVLALGLCPRKPARSDAGETGVTLALGGAAFVPGHRVYADADGVVVSPTRLHQG